MVVGDIERKDFAVSEVLLWGFLKCVWRKIRLNALTK
jgi:hypothetical protein